MKSSTGKYFIAVDHVRAIATFIVFAWHFNHIKNGQLAGPPAFPLSLLTEGHTGVSLFMALSGYLFAKLLDGKKIVYTSFLWNRFLRLAPLLLVVIILAGMRRYQTGDDLYEYANLILAGVIKPSLPNGGWSITTEFHFYLLLPALLFLSRQWQYSLLVVLMAAVIGRALVHQNLGEVQSLAYWTIIGRIDQFLLGILAFRFRHTIAGRHVVVLSSLVLFLAFFWYFDSLGGFYTTESYPSPSKLWIWLPTIEGLAYAMAISWYDNSFQHSTGRLSRIVARVGTYSYSIYLLHFFVVFRLSDLIHEYVIDLSNIYVALIVAVPAFLLMIPIGFLSYTLVESPFLRFRSKYIDADKTRIVPHAYEIQQRA